VVGLGGKPILARRRLLLTRMIETHTSQAHRAIGAPVSMASLLLAMPAEPVRRHITGQIAAFGAAPISAEET
jgi:hypothetical protein